MTRKKCATCGNLITGRSDKKYCSDQCRYVKNNGNKYESERPIIDVNKILRRNRSILKTLCPIGKATVRREVLDSMGFDVTVFSSLYLTSNKQVYYLCYDYGFTPLMEKGVEKALIVTKQPYMKGWDPWKFVKKEKTERLEPRAL